MPAIRNSAVAIGTAASSVGTTMYTVPTGYVLLLKNILLRPTTGTRPTEYAIYVADDSLGFAVVEDLPWPNQSFVNWSGWTAVNGGQHVQLNPTGGPVFYWVSGALLPFIP